MGSRGRWVYILAAAASTLVVIAIIALAPPTARHTGGGGEAAPTELLHIVVYAADALREGNISLVEKAAEALTSARIPASAAPQASRISASLLRAAGLAEEAEKLCTAARLHVETGEPGRAVVEARDCLDTLHGLLSLYPGLYGDVSSLSRLGLNVSRALEAIRAAAGRVRYAVKVAEEVLREAERLSVNLTATRLGIKAAPNPVPYGGSVTVKACLVDAEGKPLAARTLIIHHGGVSSEAVTGRNGCASITLRPRSGVAVYAEYIPAGRDRGVYSYSRSETLTVRVLLRGVGLSVLLNSSRAEPLDAVTVTVSVNASLPARVETSWGFGAVTPPGGGRVVLRVPGGVRGPAVVAVEAGGVDGYAHVVVTRSLLVEGRSPELHVSAPAIVVAGGVFSIDAAAAVPGTLHVETPWGVGGAVVAVPLTAAGHARLVIDFKPLDPRYDDARMSVEVFVVNPIPFLVAAALAAIPLSRRRRGGGGEGGRGAGMFSLLEEALGRRAEPWETAREYAAASGVDAGEAVRAYEDSAYGGGPWRVFREAVEALRRRLTSRRGGG